MLGTALHSTGVGWAGDLMNTPSVDELRTHPVFGALDAFCLERLFQVARFDQMRRHEVLCTAGERTELIHLILDGIIKISTFAFNEKEVILDILGTGDLVGEEALADERSGYTASVMRDAMMLSVPAAAVRALLARSPEFALAWIRNSYVSKFRLQQRMTELAYGSIEDRLFRILCHLVRHHGMKTSKGNSILQFPLTHQELGNLIGATRETTTVAVGRLKSAGIIGFRERKIILRDRTRSDSAEEEKVG